MVQIICVSDGLNLWAAPILPTPSSGGSFRALSYRAARNGKKYARRYSIAKTKHGAKSGFSALKWRQTRCAPRRQTPLRAPAGLPRFCARQRARARFARATPKPSWQPAAINPTSGRAIKKQQAKQSRRQMQQHCEYAACTRRFQGRLKSLHGFYIILSNTGLTLSSPASISSTISWISIVKYSQKAIRLMSCGQFSSIVSHAANSAWKISR
jgi:hypothetical protein